MTEELKHSAKGTTWKKHKYIAIKNGRYVYANDKKKMSGSGGSFEPGFNTKTYTEKVKKSKGHTKKYEEAGIQVEAGIKAGRERVANKKSEAKRQKAIAERDRVEAKHKSQKPKQSKYTSERLERRAKEILASGKKDAKTSSKVKNLQQKAAKASKTFWKNAMNDSKGAGQSHSDYYKRKGTGKAKNKTYRKNQRRAAFNTAVYKGKSRVKKFLKKIGIGKKKR